MVRLSLHTSYMFMPRCLAHIRPRLFSAMFARLFAVAIAVGFVGGLSYWLRTNCPTTTILGRFFRSIVSLSRAGLGQRATEEESAAPDRPDFAFNARDDGKPVILKGDPDESELIHRITATNDDVMPPAEEQKPLNAAEIASLKKWITQGR